MSEGGVTDKQTVCLSMIVRNEGKVLARCLRSVRPLIDAWAIVDTGSTDDTCEVIRRELAGIPGELKVKEHPPRTLVDRLRNRGHFDFSANRNAALELARKSGCDYALLIDADEEIVLTNGSPKFPPLVLDRYCATFRVSEGSNSRVWHRTLLVKNEHPWRFIYPIHEALHSDDPNATAGLLKGLEVPSYSDGARNQDKIAKYRRDSEALKAAIRKDPKEPRFWFYLGQSLASCERHMQALEAYQHRYDMPEQGWDEERWYALYQQAPLKELLGYPWEEVRASYLRAFNARPWRAEPLWAAGIISADHGELGVAEAYLRHALDIPIPLDSFLIDEAIYNWRITDELAGIYVRMGRAEDCEKVLTRLLDSGRCPAEERDRIAENLVKAGEHKTAEAA